MDLQNIGYCPNKICSSINSGTVGETCALCGSKMKQFNLKQLSLLLKMKQASEIILDTIKNFKMTEIMKGEKMKPILKLGVEDAEKILEMLEKENKLKDIEKIPLRTQKYIYSLISD